MRKRLLFGFILLAYGVMLIEVMVFRNIPIIRIGHLMFNLGGADANGRANLIPFKTILSYLFDKNGLFAAAVNLVGNIVLLMPVGFLVPLVFRTMTWKKSLALAVATGFAIEGTQVLFHTGIFDVDDVMLNGLGLMIGYWVFKMFVTTENRP